MDTNRCKYCQQANCEDCPEKKNREALDTSILREYIAGLEETKKIPFINHLLVEEGLEPI